MCNKIPRASRLQNSARACLTRRTPRQSITTTSASSIRCRSDYGVQRNTSMKTGARACGNTDHRLETLMTLRFRPLSIQRDEKRQGCAHSTAHQCPEDVGSVYATHISFTHSLLIPRYAALVSFLQLSRISHHSI